MKKTFIIMFLLKSLFIFSQEKLQVLNDTEIYDKDGKLFRFYTYGATLDLVKKYDTYAEVQIDSNVYKVEAKYYTKVARKQINIGMTDYEVVKILGQPDDTSTMQTQYSLSKIYVYGKTYYHFDDDKLVAINTY